MAVRRSPYWKKLLAKYPWLEVSPPSNALDAYRAGWRMGYAAAMEQIRSDAERHVVELARREG